MPTKQIIYTPASRGEANDELQNQMDPGTFMLHIDEEAFSHLLEGGLHKENLNDRQYHVVKLAADGQNYYDPQAEEIEQVFGTADKRTVTEFIVRYGELINP